MARATAPEISTINARKRLRRAHKPYWRLIENGLHVGCYVGKDVRWAARRYVGDRRYEETALGLAEDTNRPADGETVLTFDQAQSRAREWRRERETPLAPVQLPIPTVGDVIRSYAENRRKRGGRNGLDVAWRLGKHVPTDDPLFCLTLDSLDAQALTEWRQRRLNSMAAATANRLMNDVRAALNAAGRTHRTRLPASFVDAVRDGLRGEEGADSSRPAQILSDADVRRLVQAAYEIDEDFGSLVLVLAATGARFSMAARITVADLQIAEGRILVPTSRKGRGGRKATHTPIPLPDDVIGRLRPLTVGRRGHEVLLMRWHHRQVTGDKSIGKLPTWVREERRPWRVAADMARAWSEARSATGLSADVVPYALRHSSIVRGLRAGLPIRLVAASHDTSAAMIEKHYSAFIVSATEDLLRRAAIPMAPDLPTHLRAVR